MTYKDAGVDIDAGESLVNKIKPLAKKTARPGTSAGLGGFAGLFDLKAAGFNDPLILATTDGVGTKLKIAIDIGYHDTIGIDLVAMCVNDLIVQGAEPLLFLDYYATGKLDVSAGYKIISGISEGCRQAGAALVGGETAEMPGLYHEEDYDLAGFAVGAVERDNLIDGQNIQEEDCILGLESSGLHSNGFSLVRKIIESNGLFYHFPSPISDHETIGHMLLTPTKIYVKSCLAAVKTKKIKGMAHITGGGLLDNVPRTLPPDLVADLKASSWPIPKIFKWLQKLGNIAYHEMYRTFNCGIGMILIVHHADKNEIISVLKKTGETVYELGKVRSRQNNENQCCLSDIEQSWHD